MKRKKRLPAEFHEWEAKYSASRSLSDKLLCLEGMLLSVPKDDSFNKLKTNLNQRVKDLKTKISKERLRRTVLKQPVFNKELPTIGLIGLANSGKTALINELCSTNYASTALPFETKTPALGVFDYEGVKIQLIEVPSSLEPKHVQLLRSVNLVLMLGDDLTSILVKYGVSAKLVFVKAKPSKEQLWSWLGLVRVYSPKSKEPTLLPAGSTIKDFVTKLRSGWLKRFISARVTGPSAKYPKQEAGLKHVLKDKDLVELKLK